MGPPHVEARDLAPFLPGDMGRQPLHDPAADHAWGSLAPHVRSWVKSRTTPSSNRAEQDPPWRPPS